MLSVVRMSPMETRHARKDCRHDHTITIIIYNHVPILATFSARFVLACSKSIKIDESFFSRLYKLDLEDIFCDHFVLIHDLYRVVHETHLTNSRTILELVAVSSIPPPKSLLPFFLVSFLFLSIEQPCLTFTSPRSS